MNELALVGLHRFKAHIAAVRVRKNTELTFLCLCPLGVVAEELERKVLVGDVVICVTWVNIEGLGELAVAFLSETLFVALEWLAVGASGFEAGGKTFDFLFSSLTVASEKRLGLAWSLLLACEWSMALVEVLVAARLASLATRLTAMTTRYIRVLAVSTMT